MMRTAIQHIRHRARMHVDYSSAVFTIGRAPTILPEVPGGKERTQVSSGQISRDFSQTSGGVFRRQSPLRAAGGAVRQVCLCTCQVS